jgi:replicative DNA helicase
MIDYRQASVDELNRLRFEAQMHIVGHWLSEDRYPHVECNLEIVDVNDFSHPAIKRLAATIKELGTGRPWRDIARKADVNETDVFKLAEWCISPSATPLYVQRLKRINAELALRSQAEEFALGHIGVDGLRAAIDEAEIVSADSGVVSLHDALKSLERMEARTGLQTGLPRLDKIIGGLLPGNLITIAGRPGAGKSALAQQIATQIAAEKKVLYVSLEMSPEEIAARAVAGRDITPRDLLVGGKGTPALFAEAEERAKGIHFEITAKGKTISEIRSTINSELPELVVIDTANLVKAEGETERVRMLNVTRDLKQAAMGHDVAVLMLTQLNRDAEDNPTPTLANLKESGSVEEDSDIVILLSELREYKHVEKTTSAFKHLDLPSYAYEDIKKAGGSVMFASVGKNRNGKRGALLLRFNGAEFKFSEIHSEDPHEGGSEDELPF